jgi:transposase
MILDGSSAHLNNKLIIPKNLTLHFLPPYSPQLNPIERLWSFIKRNYLSFKRYKDIDEVMQSGVEAWKKINQTKHKPHVARSWEPINYPTEYDIITSI